MEYVTRPFIICAPSGAGKSSIINALFKNFPDYFAFSVSHTTRNPRPGEIDGVHYHFIDRDSFYSRLENGEFLEHAHVHNNHYGTSISSVRTCAKNLKICVLDIDIQGLKQICEANNGLDPVCIFINSPNMEELERRLRGRGTENEESVQLRVKNAYIEIAEAEKCDYIHARFINDDLQECIDNVVTTLSIFYPQLKLEHMLQSSYQNNVEVLEIDRSFPIGNAGTLILCRHLEKLKESHHYHTLALQSNQIGDEGANALFMALQADTKIHTVDLCCNNLTDKCVESLLQLLKMNQTLQTINLANNTISEQERHKLLDAAKEKSITLVFDAPI